MNAPQTIEHLDTGVLIPYARNSRTHSPEQVRQIAASIREFGFTNPVLIDADNGIIAGHGRVMAAQQLGLQSVPCLRLGYLSDAQKRAYIIADNKLALNAGWDEAMLKLEFQELQALDFDLELTGFGMDELDDFLEVEEQKPDGAADQVPEVRSVVISRPGDVWVMGEHRLMCGDSTRSFDVDRLLDGKKIDLIFSDPPYGVSYSDKNKFLNAADEGNRNQTPIENDHLSLDETGQLWADVFSLWSQYFNDYSSYYIASPQRGELFLMMMMMMNKHGFPLRHCIIWNKNNHVLGLSDYNYKHEPILYGWAKRHKFYGGGSHKFSVWDIPKPLKNDLHPTMKPVALVENCILNSSEKGMLVADMFSGSGTSIMAAENTRRKGYAMELSPAYVDVGVRRWQDYTGKQAVRESDGLTFDQLAAAAG